MRIKQLDTVVNETRSTATTCTTVTVAEGDYLNWWYYVACCYNKDYFSTNKVAAATLVQI